jgi:hypothetical protein
MPPSGLPRSRSVFCAFCTFIRAHDLAAMNLRRLAPVDRGAPAHLRVAVDSNQKPAGADPLLHDVFELGRGLLLLVHAVSLSYLLRCIGSCARKAASPAGVMR